MNRKKIMHGLSDFLSPSDVIFCVGKLLVSESYFAKDRTIFYHLDDYIDVLSIAIGMSINTDKRVVVIMEDYYLLRHFSSILQAAVSKCRNLFFFVIVSNIYDIHTTQTTISESFRNLSGSVFNLGFFAYNYTNYFNNKVEIKKAKAIFKSARGPFFSILNINDQRLYATDTKTNDITLFKNKFHTKIVDDSSNTNYLNLDAFVGGN